MQKVADDPNGVHNIATANRSKNRYHNIHTCKFKMCSFQIVLRTVATGRYVKGTFCCSLHSYSGPLHALESLPPQASTRKRLSKIGNTMLTHRELSAILTVSSAFKGELKKSGLP